MLFSHVKISSFRAKAHLVFHWCLYNKNTYEMQRLSQNVFFYGKQDNGVQKVSSLHILSVDWAV